MFGFLDFNWDLFLFLFVLRFNKTIFNKNQQRFNVIIKKVPNSQKAPVIIESEKTKIYKSG